MGSAGGRIPKQAREKAFQLGREIAKCDCVLLTGACPGLPYEAVRGCKAEGGMTVGISPALNLHEHVSRYRSPHRDFDVLIYTGDGLMGREITGIRSCDIVILVGGRSGTLGEFAIAYDEAKVIGVLEGTGGITEHLKNIINFVKKETGAVICYDADPERLLDKLEQVYRERILPRHLEVLEGRDPDGVLEPDVIGPEHVH